jgi:hypothetical protein
MNFVLKVSKTVAAEPVQLMSTKPRQRDGCFNPKRAKTLALGWIVIRAKGKEKSRLMRE